MKIIEETVKELKTLSPSHMLVVHDLVVSLKRGERALQPATSGRTSYRRAQRAFISYKGNLSDDVIAMRKDRV